MLLSLRVCLLLIVLAFSVTGSLSTVNCTQNCTCFEGLSRNSLTVDCHGSPDVDVDQLTEQLDSLLSSSLMYGRLTSLSISNTPLRHVPRSVCRLTTLTRLNLDNNRLTRLPDDCLSNLKELGHFSASNNDIEILQDGLIDCLDNLYFFELSHNRIRSIGLSVFSRPTNLPNLRYIGLSDNNLTSLEPWPYYRGIQGTRTHLVEINLKRNNINKFTNEIGFKVGCRLGVPYMSLYLNENPVQHYIDMVNGWNLTIEGFTECARRNGYFIHTFVLMYNNSFLCDCIDYHFYRAVLRWPVTQPVRKFFYCYYHNPATNKWLAVNPFNLQMKQFICKITQQCPPGCRCVHRPANATLHVYCSNSNLTALPLQLPDLPSHNTSYKLDFSNNPLIGRLQVRRYLSDTAILDVSYCGIEYVTAAQWKQLTIVPEVYLDGNKIAALPKSAASENVSTVKLSIDGNPWDCSCENVWMADWFASISDRLTSSEIFCDSPERQKGKNMLQLPRNEFCVNPTTEAVKRALIITLSTVAGVVVVSLLVGVIGYRLRVRLYTRWKFHPFDRDECLGEDMDYDVFLCSSSADHQPYGMRVLTLIESKGYKVCYHLRDFLGGEAITDNMVAAVRRSKRTVCLLTENFIASGYCMEEFNISYHHNVVENRTKRLIVLMALRNRDDFNADTSPSTLSLRQYLRQYTYIDYTAGDWLDKLLYTLPLRGLLQPNHDSGADDDRVVRDAQTQLVAENDGDDIPIMSLV